MFRVRVKTPQATKDFLWLNKKEDDFIRFLPDHFGVKPEDIEIHYLKSAWGKKRNIELFLTDEEKAQNVQVNFGFVNDDVFIVKSWVEKTKQVNPETQQDEEIFTAKNEVVGSALELIPCKAWPYEQGAVTIAGVELIFTGNFDKEQLERVNA